MRGPNRGRKIGTCVVYELRIMNMSVSISESLSSSMSRYMNINVRMISLVHSNVEGIDMVSILVSIERCRYLSKWY